ncbi:MAG: hypothetical protein Q9180_006764 [Flavoplaca navasiana]
MSQSYIEAHKAEEAVRALEQKVSLLMTKNREQAGKNESFEKKIHALEKKSEDLDVRLKAAYVFLPSSPEPPLLLSSNYTFTHTYFHTNIAPFPNSEHNALSRHLNALIPPSSHHQNLHPLHSIHTNTPLKNFPRKESDIRTMSTLDVNNLLKELDAQTGRKMDAGERKARLKEVIGVGERSSVVQNPAVVDSVDGVKQDGGEKKKEDEKKKVLPGKATGPPPGKVLPIGPKD